MRFNDDNVDVPEHLVKALNSDELVLFIGAGVSAKAYPNQKPGTYYPTFTELVEKIAANSGREPIAEHEKRWLVQGFADKVLGEWEQKHVDIHDHAAQILSDQEDVKRLDPHRAIVRLFPEGAEPRIITTNFDNLLVKARDKEGLKDWQVYEAPALPPARKGRFQGICFLHGRVSNPGEMILTDRDIGKAYMDEGWALKFAHELFHNFSVLFVGYKLEDPPLRYLSLALAGHNEKQHWVLLPDPGNEKARGRVKQDWGRRGITAIWYPVTRNDYRALERTIYDWGKDNRLQFIDRRNLLRTWAESEPGQLLPHQMDCAQHFMAASELLRDFVEAEPREAWFESLVEWGHFDSLLKGHGRPAESDWLLSRKLAGWVLARPEQWLMRLVPYRVSMHPSLVDEFFSALERDWDKYLLSKKDLVVLLEFLKPAIKLGTRRRVERQTLRVVTELVENGCFEEAIWLFLEMLDGETTFVVRPDITFLMARDAGEDVTGLSPEKLEIEVDHRNFSDYHFKHLLNKVFIPHADTIGYAFLMALTQRLLDLRHTEKILWRGLGTHYRRKAIEPHEQDKYSNGFIDFVVSALRDVWEALLEKAPDEAATAYEYWCSLDEGFFKRLSLHAARKMAERE